MWANHQQMIRKGWDERVADGDLVLMPGDFSWNNDPADLRYDFLWINDRPGTKILSPGNHDYGVWDSQDNVAEFCAEFESLHPLKNHATRIENPYHPQAPGLVIVGVEGTQAPQDKYFNTNAGISSQGKNTEAARFLHEMLLLERSLKQAERIRQAGDCLVVQFHYSPFAHKDDDKNYVTVFSKMIERAGASLCLYGHLHQEKQFRMCYQGKHEGCEYRFVGADFVLFQPTRIGELTAEGLVLGALEIDAATYWPAPQPVQKKFLDKNKGNDKKKNHQGGTAKQQNTGQRKPAWGDDKGLVCLECHSPVFAYEPHHFDKQGAIHGQGSYGERGTCLYSRAGQEAKTPARAPAGDPQVRSINSSEFQAMECVGCHQVIFTHEDFGHTYGVGHWHQPNCNTPTIIQARQNPSADDTHFRELSTPLLPCIECQQEIVVGELYHHAESDTIHGAGSHGERGTCEKAPTRSDREQSVRS